MTGGAGLQGGVADEAVWWYRDGVATLGPISTFELRRLAEGPLGPATLVWRKTFGDRWKRLDATLADAREADAPPTNDYGSWTKSFATFEAHPGKNQWGWLGLFGPLAYFYLGMWQRALVIVAVGLSFELLFAIAEYGRESRPHVLHDLLILSFCARNIKRDYYNSRVLGEPMWSRLRFMRNGYACAALVGALVLANVAVAATDPVDNLVADVTGVWQGDAGNVIIDVAGQTKTITYDGGSHTVHLASANGTNEVIVFQDVRRPGTLITFHKHWTEDGTKYSVDMLVNDQLVANLSYVRPV